MMLWRGRRVNVVTCRVAVGDKPPREFRIWRRGVNPSVKGPVVFDAVAARDVMREFNAHGTDIMIDLEHLSLDPKRPTYDPDARGWCKLEVRNGELWAVDVRWTEDGAARISSRRQRYISPAFLADPKTRRALCVINAALTSLPATDAPHALIAANHGVTMDEEIDLGTISKTLDECMAACAAFKEALDSGDQEKAKAAGLDAQKAIDACEIAMIPLVGPDADAAAEEQQQPVEGAAQGAPAPEPANKEEPMPNGGKPGAVKKVTTEFHTALANEVSSLQQQLNQRDVRDLIRDNRSKFTPALEKWALTLTPDTLRSWLKNAPVLEVHNAAAREPRVEPKTAKVALTSAEMQVASLCGTDPNKLLAHKRQLATAGAVIEEE